MSGFARVHVWLSAHHHRCFAILLVNGAAGGTPSLTSSCTLTDVHNIAVDTFIVQMPIPIVPRGRKRELGHRFHDAALSFKTLTCLRPVFSFTTTYCLYPAIERTSRASVFPEVHSHAYKQPLSICS